MAVLKQSTAYTRMFLIVQSSDHVTGLTGASPTVNISKAGGSFAAAGGTVTEVGNGWYKIALTTTDTNTLGDLAYHITATSGDPTDFVDQVASNILGDTLPANATQINGVSTSSVTTVNANVGTTQPINFTGTAGSALIKSDMVDVAGSAVSTSAAQIGVNVINIGGTAQTASDLGVLNSANGIETGYTIQQTMRLMFSALCGKVSGLPGSPVFRDVPDTKNRITATTDSNGNRSAVTLVGT